MEEDNDVDILNTIKSLTSFYCNNMPLVYSKENFEELLLNEIIENIRIFDFNLFGKNNEFYLTHIRNVLKELDIERCSGDTFIIEKSNDEKEKIINIIEKIKNVKQPEQRTPEWYDFRHNNITASSAWKVFGTQSSINQLIYEKCSPINVEKYKPTLVENTLTWGHKYEDVSIMIYENKYNTKIRDYGLVPHEKYNYIAASPDGINDDVNSPLFGRMLEIKNIVNRKINGIPKKEYWIQMQLQMEVCDLDECDFLETKFTEYEKYDDFINDGTFTRTKDNKQKGAIIYFMKNEDKSPYYCYMPIDYSYDQFKTWEEEMLNNHLDDYTWIKNIYWKLDKISVVLVKRNRNWFKEALPHFKNIWDIIISEKESGEYIKRAPKKRKPKVEQDKTLNSALIT